MTDEEFDLFIERLKKDLRKDSSEPASVCPSCKQLLSEAAAERIQKSQETQSN